MEIWIINIIGRISRTIELPQDLNEPFEIKNNAILDHQVDVQRRLANGLEADINVNEMEICYQIQKRPVRYGKAKRCNLTTFYPSERKYFDLWSLGYDTNINLVNFELFANLVREVCFKIITLGIGRRIEFYIQR